MFSLLIQKIKTDLALKQRILHLIMHPVKTRPRFWLCCLQFLYIKRGKKSVIYRSVRKDIVPFNIFKLRYCSVVEDYAIINNECSGVLSWAIIPGSVWVIH